MIKKRNSGVHSFFHKVVAVLMVEAMCMSTLWAAAPPPENWLQHEKPNGVATSAPPFPRKTIFYSYREETMPAANARRVFWGHDIDRSAPVEIAGMRAPREAAFLATTAAVMPVSQPPATLILFGPRQYLRTTGPKNVYTATINVPAYIGAPFTLHIQNGEADGSHRVSSAMVEVNGVAIAGQSDFNQNVFALDRSVALTPQTTLRVTLASQPESYLTIFMEGRKLDLTPPSISITQPTQGSFINTSVPRISILYSDSKGGDDPVASGINSSSLKVFMDGVDRSNLFVVQPDGASADVPAIAALPEGSHVVTAAIQDIAGNSSSASAQFTVDKTPPDIAATLTPAPNPAGWNNSDVQIAYRCSDALSGVAACPESQLVSSEGKTQRFSAAATDRAGNRTAISSELNIDKTAPVVAATVSPAPNASGWNNSNVTVSFTCKDELSGVASCENPVTVSSDGAAQAIRGKAMDIAGNAGSTSATINLDKTPPTITATVSPAPNAKGWNNSNVTITFQCNDEGSGIANCPAPVLVESEGANQALNGTATDVAGNSASTSVTLNLAKTPPAISAAASPAPNATDWNNSDVTVTFTCAASVASIESCPEPEVAATEGPSQVISRTVQDVAGNSASASLTLNIDKTSPAIAASSSPSANEAGWNKSDVTVSYACSDSISGVEICSPPVVVSGEGKDQLISGETVDLAGNKSATSVTLSIEKTLPQISATVSPVPNAAGWNNSEATVNFTCTPSASEVIFCSLPATVGLEGKGMIVNGKVTDQADNQAETSVTLNIDRTRPRIGASPAPPPNSSGWNSTDVTVSYQCADELSGIASCPGPESVIAEGANQQISATAIDQAGNTSPAAVTLNIDRTPPTITAAADPSPNVAGWNNSNVTVSYSCVDELSGIDVCPSPSLIAAEGQNQTTDAQAVDRAGNTASTTISLSIDKTIPQIVQLSAPDQISRNHGGTVTVTASDNFTIEQVTVKVNGSVLQTFTSAPYQADLPVPMDALPGDTLIITADAVDQAGNVAHSSRGVRIAADGVIAGQVLSGDTGLPLPGAKVEVLGRPDQTDITDEHGRYSIQVTDNHLFLRVSKDADQSENTLMTAVEREIAVQSGAGTVPVDARLAALADPRMLDASNGTISVENLTLLPANPLGEATPVRFTVLSGQTLPGLLPMGWSPLTAFDLQTNTASSFTVKVTKLPTLSLHLVNYSFAAHAWLMVTPGLTADAEGNLTVGLPLAGTFALVAVDVNETPIEIAAPGQPIKGEDMVMLSPLAGTTGKFDPAVLPASGGTSAGALLVQSPTPVPSGTVIQSTVAEDYSLRSGENRSEQVRQQDIVLYRYPASEGAAVAASFPVTPSRAFQPAELASGKVHLDILAGREGVRGVPGGRDPVIVQSGDATLTVLGGSLGQDTVVSVNQTAIANFLPSSATLEPVAELIVDFSGDTLATTAQLSLAAANMNATDHLLLARVDRQEGAVRLVVAALAQVSGGRLVSVPYPGLQGIIQGGEYVFYKIFDPIGFVSGVATTSAGPVKAMVQTDELPFVAFASANGNYIVGAASGVAHLRASVPQTALSGTASIETIPQQTVSSDITLTGVLTAATIAPQDGAIGVNVSSSITITTTSPVNASTVVAENLKLFQGAISDNQSIPLRFVLTQGGKNLAVVPEQKLQPATRYTFLASGLADIFGGLVSVPAVTFTTKVDVPPVYDFNKLTFSFPDENGNVRITAPVGTFPAGTTLLIVDLSNGIVLSLTAGNDGSVTGQIQATIDDRLQITVTDPLGAVTTFERSQFVAEDGSVAIGPGGGTVTGPGGVEIRVPDGALDKSAVLKIEAFGPDLFPERPDLPGANFGSGLKVTASRPLTLKKEAHLAFPKPSDAPDGSFYYVYRRVVQPNGNITFETIDHAFVEGTGDSAKVVTASPPFFGGLGFGVLDMMFMSWTPPAVPLPGVVTGKVLRAVNPGTPENPGKDVIFVPIAGARVSGADAQGFALMERGTNADFATSQADGTYSMFDAKYEGGTLNLIAIAPTGEQLSATAFEAHPFDSVSIFEHAGPALTFYKNIASANFTFPALKPAPPAPRIGITVYKLDQNGFRGEAGGIIIAGTPLRIAFKADQQPTATIQGAPHATQPDAPDAQNDSKLDYKVSDMFTPSDPGTYTIVATVLPVFSNTPVTASKSFLVVAAGGGNSDINQSAAPEVIEVFPKEGGEGVPVTAFPNAVFSEPVTRVPGNVILEDSGGNRPLIKVTGVGMRDGNPVVLENLSGNDAVTSITIQPLTGLKFGEKYTLTFTSGITDLDATTDANGNIIPAPKALSASAIHFRTFGPEVLGGTDARFASTRALVMGERAYLARIINGVFSVLEAYDISDPASPAAVPSVQAGFPGRAQDIAGEEASALAGGGNLVVVATGAMASEVGIPANLWMYDVSGDQARRVGAVSVTGSASQEGVALRLQVKGQYAYTSTFRKGIQVVDLGRAREEFEAAMAGDVREFSIPISTEGQGFARDAVVNTIAVERLLPDGVTVPVTLFDLKVGDFLVGGSDPGNPRNQRLVVATGVAPLVVADPLGAGASGVIYQGAVQAPGGTLALGRALALGQLNDTDANGDLVAREMAVVVGTDVGGAALLAVVDMSIPSSPLTLSVLSLSSYPTDVLIKDSVALVGTAENKVLLVNLNDPRNPVSAGQIGGEGLLFGDRLALTQGGLVLSTSFDGSRGGIQSATLGIFSRVTATPTVLLADRDARSIDEVNFQYQLIGDLSQVESANLELRDEKNQLVFTTPVPVKAKGEFRWPAGQHITVTPSSLTVQVLNVDGMLSLPVEAQPELANGNAPTPVISSISPSRIEVGSSKQEISLIGRNFGPGTHAQLVRSEDGIVLDSVPTVYVSASQIKLRPADEMFTQTSTWKVVLSNLYSNSNQMLFKVVPTGLPPAPVLSAIVPSQLSASDAPQDTWITLQGSNFKPTSVVKHDRGDQQLTTEFASSSELKVLIPSSWIAGPFVTRFYVTSGEDDDLKSDEQTFEVLNTVGFVLPPSPLVSAVNDGFVPLGNPSSTEAISVTVNGDGFQSGAQVIVAVDGEEIPVPTNVLSSSTLSARIPIEIWSARNLTAHVGIQIRNGPLVTGSALALPKKRITFDKPDKDACTGFHKRTVKGNPEEYFLAIPVDEANTVKARIPGDYLKDKTQQVAFDLDDPRLLSVSPIQTQQKDQILTLQGLANFTLLTQLRAVKNQIMNGTPTKFNLGVLGTQTMPRRDFNVYVHFVGELNGKNKPNRLSEIRDAASISTFVNWLQTGINDIWGPQANVHFVVKWPTTSQPEAVHFDIATNDGGVDGGTEKDAIIRVFPLPNSTAINLYFVQKFDSVREGRGVAGFAPPIGGHIVFVSDRVSGQTKAAIQVIAHEIGHSIGLSHTVEKDGSFNNTYIDKNSSDKNDSRSLMWWSAGADRCHIGAPHWFELNDANK